MQQKFSPHTRPPEAVPIETLEQELFFLSNCQGMTGLHGR
jgi:hypothetical protein